MFVSKYVFTTPKGPTLLNAHLCSCMVFVSVSAHMFYASFLHLEYSQRHPVMLVFCDLLNQATPKTSGELRDVAASFDEIPDSHADVHTFADKENRAVRRWWKAYTLVRNPSLVQLKNEVPLQDDVTCA